MEGSGATDRTAERNPALIAAVKMLSAKRLTRMQLRRKLRERGFGDEAVAAALAECERRQYLDDRTYAQLYVDGVLQRKAVGRRRLQHELFERGVSGEVASDVLARLEGDEDQRLERALAKLEAARPQDRPAQLGRRLERLGFGAAAIARALRRRARERDFGAEVFEESR